MSKMLKKKEPKMFLIENLEGLFWNDNRNWVERENAHEYAFVSDLPYRMVAESDVETKGWIFAFQGSPIREHSKEKEFKDPETG